MYLTKMVHLVSKKTRTAVSIFDFDIQALFGLTDAGVFHCMNWLFISRSYWKRPYFLQVTAVLKKIGISSVLFKNLGWSPFLVNFWSSVRFLDFCTHFFHVAKICLFPGPYSTPLLSFWCVNNKIFWQVSLPYPHFSQFRSSVDVRVVYPVPFWKQLVRWW